MHASGYHRTSPASARKPAADGRQQVPQHNRARRVLGALDARMSPVTFTAFMANAEFCVGAPAFALVASLASHSLTGRPVHWPALPHDLPEFMHALAQPAKIGVVAAGIAWFLFGTKASPTPIKVIARYAERLATRAVGPRYAAAVARQARRAVYRFVRAGTITNGFVGSTVPHLRSKHGHRALFAHPSFGTYTMADLHVWWREMGLNISLGAAWAWALDLPVAPMMISNVYFSFLATLTTARVTKLLAPHDGMTPSERDDLELRVRLWRTFVFSTLNSFSTLAATDCIDTAWAYGLQAVMGAAIAVYAYTHVHAPESVPANAAAA